MDKPCGRSAMKPMVIISIATRLVFGLTLDYTDALNASWMCPLLGFILFLPIALAVKRLTNTSSEKQKISFAAVSVLFSLLLIFDASAATHLLANTADIMALGEAPVWLLALPLVLLIFVCGIFGMEAEGYSARLWIRTMLPILAVVIIVQFRNYQFDWLLPLFGGGFGAIVKGAIYTSGYMTLLTLPWLLCVDDTEHSGILHGTFTGTISAVIILMLLAMLSPTLTGTTLSKSGRIELILSNGRVHLMLQMLTVVLWFANLLHLMNTETTAASSFLLNAFPRLSRKFAAGFIALAVFGCTIAGFAVKDPYAGIFSKCLYPVISAVILLMLIRSFTVKRRQPHAENH